MLIPAVKALHCTADHEVNDTVEDKTHRSLWGMFGKEDYRPVKETVSQEGFRNENPASPWYLVLGIDAEYVRILAHLPKKSTIQSNNF